MNEILKCAVNAVREDLGYPASLIQLLERCPDVRATLDGVMPSIAASSVARWDRFGRHSPQEWPHLPDGVLSGWKWAGGQYAGFNLQRQDVIEIGQRTLVPDWTCDISSVHGFSSSKSRLDGFCSTDEMVEAKSQDMICPVTLAKLEENLAHREIRIFEDRGATDYFVRYEWDGRLWLMNDGGSHHFAAAKYIAARLRHPVSLRGKLYSYSLNAGAITSLHRDFEMFVISDEPSIGNAFLTAMRAFKATWLSLDVPAPFKDVQAVLLPRSERRSLRAAAELRKAGIVDLGAHLLGLAARQLNG
ncbi:DUF6685 family protein [Burkholderia vietnamiensis]|uniref:DUF6685 family protein n=1 Tax=Burkholderia vietnamiensis TaxID=60552 RepID=UPI001594577A|nr:DUF6685 family protein [Burkholderia vietnamiensis]